MKLENIKLTDFKNGIWPSVDKSNIQSLIDECNILANKGQLIGELLDDDYIIPMISIIDLRNVSHIITNLNIQEDGIYGDVKILDTPRVALMSVFEQEFNAKFKFKIRATLSIGSLGGGNHFIEVGKSEKTGEIYLVIHSGSRKLGGDVCKYYQDKAFQNVNEMTKIKDHLIKKLKLEGKEKEINSALKQIQKPSADRDLAYLSGSDFNDYMNDMQIVQSFASLNRITMAKIILEEMNLSSNSRFETIHNYIDFKRMMLRKGAVSSENGELMLIPINMRDGSLLCIGKGNEEWNYSAPHGAGRILSRTKAKELISMDDFTESMKGIYTTSVNEFTLDEAPQAYKPIEEIKSLIVDTVDVIDTIKPLYNFKAK